MTAGFLHFGPLHLGLNLLGLWILGRRVERAWGRARFIACYLLATVASTSLFTLFVSATAQPLILVGASGGVMGLLGALLGRAFVARLKRRTSAASQDLAWLALVVAFQVAFDLSTPVVSSTAHIIGLSAGLVFSLLPRR